MIKRRNRTKHTKTFEERLAEEAARFKEAAAKLPPGTQRELNLRRARQADTAAHINEWLTSPGLQPPKALENIQSGRTEKRGQGAG
ncbi:hypothetical protein [Bradyrhizobium japonicum]|uniref:hypothetical protein n=1 Tax=Bradyrhizobium japonicum TaxID=375 RepID=UPI00190F1213|nr:hypothetical protein [Bradyrhizobium japonicum]MCD9109812.1 hypothetical protein [Bradyrhizobium japonicum]MCD9256782.1 hypothetical protein [Bradyrhizobium japonicum SEMIA 5079]MCD9823647.1 hypothetical protein [Bradyrhizobium japonicum]MCD9898287.1 hypothetical protein [Bradyrhizobium japonicum]MCD9910274.1 hypothetical protein [Bradyrhizobium japonicum]